MSAKSFNVNHTTQLPQGITPPQQILKRSRFVVTAAIKKVGAKHVVCTKTLVAKPDQIKRLQRKCQDIMDFSQGKATNQANGIIEFMCNQDIHDKTVFHFWERYDGNTSLGRHNTTPEFVKFMEGVSIFSSSQLIKHPLQHMVKPVSGVGKDLAMIVSREGCI